MDIEIYCMDKFPQACSLNNQLINSNIPSVVIMLYTVRFLWGCHGSEKFLLEKQSLKKQKGATRCYNNVTSEIDAHPFGTNSAVNTNSIINSY